MNDPNAAFDWGDRTSISESSPNAVIGPDDSGFERYRVKPITEVKQVKAVVEKFRQKYGPGDVKKVLLKV
jgi:hypothetical protein